MLLLTSTADLLRVVTGAAANGNKAFRTAATVSVF